MEEKGITILERYNGREIGRLKGLLATDELTGPKIDVATRLFRVVSETANRNLPYAEAARWTRETVLEVLETLR